MNMDSPMAVTGVLLAELSSLPGGVADTSTLIYLERLRLLQLAAQSLRLVVIPQVVREFGTQPKGDLAVIEAPPGPADQVVWQMAAALRLPVLTEDRGIIQKARKAGLPYYNALMVVLALHLQGFLNAKDCREALNQLPGFARYSPRVVAVGEAVWAAIRAKARAG